MKTLQSSPVTYVYFIFLLVISQQVASETNVEEFLKCLPNLTYNKTILHDAVYTPKNSSFSSILESYIRNERFNEPTTPKPLLIVTALDYSHVQATVMCAKAHGLQIRIRSGGHDYEGLSYMGKEPFVLLDLSNIRAIDINIEKGTAWAQAGATLGELYYKIASLSKKHAFPAGVCHTLGLGGHISGGGYGNLLRAYGLSADNVIDAIVVDARGEILNREDMGEDLFWAIRGGGGASFAVILAWKIRLVPVPETVTVFNVGRTLEQGATDIIDQWQRVAPTVDTKLFIRAQPRAIVSEKDGKKTVQVSFIAQYLGRANHLVQYLSHSFPLLGLRKEDCIEMPWVNTTLFWFDTPAGAPLETLLNRTARSRYYAKFRSDYVKQPIPKAGFEALWKKLLEFQEPFVQLQFNPYGGLMSRLPSNRLPFPHRAGNLFKIQYTSIWFVKNETLASAGFKASNELYETLAPYVSKNPREHFLNYRDIEVGTNEDGNATFARGYFKDNLPRLLAVKARADPENFFRYEQSIPVIHSS